MSDERRTSGGDVLPPAPERFGRVVVAVPTFRRPELLGRLLGELHHDLAAVSATLIIADNDCDPAVEALVSDFATRWPATHYVPVAERGLARVRNAIVAAATEHVSDWRWLAMLDDDGQVSPGWLATLLACGETHHGHLVGGPVEGVLPAGASRLARVSIFASRRRWPSGPVETLNTTQNLAISRALLTLLPPPLFSLELNLSGGEDYDLFRRTALAGGRLVWCDEAPVREPAPADRLTARALLSRYWTTGTYMAAIDARLDGRKPAWIGAVKGGLASLSRLIGAAVRLDRDGAARQTLTLAHFAGRIAGLFGRRTARYLVHTPAEKTS